MPVASPPCDGDHVEGLVEEGAEVGEGWEGEGVGGLEGEVDVGEGFEAEVEGLFVLVGFYTNSRCKRSMAVPVVITEQRQNLPSISRWKKKW